MKENEFNELFIKELRDLYSAENQLIDALPKMADACTSSELRQAFEEHLRQTQGHADRLEQIFAELEQEVEGKKCKGMEGLIKEGKAAIKEYDGEVLDAALISAAQRVEHYEIAAYGCVRTFANVLGEAAVVNLLQQTLDEEKAADRKLSELADAINVDAAVEAVQAREEERAQDQDAEEGVERESEVLPLRDKSAKAGGGE